MTRRVWAAVVGIVAVLAVSCGQSDTRSNATQDSSPTTSSTEFASEDAERCLHILVNGGTIDDCQQPRSDTAPTSSLTTDKERLLDAFSKRCEHVGPRLGFNNSMSGVTMPTVEMIRSGFVRANESVPTQLANLNGDQPIALCSFFTVDPTRNASRTTMCPNGEIAEIGPPPPQVEYVVDADLTATKFPGVQYLLPPGMTVPATTPDPCAGLGSP
jgi:hypothetical protein